MQPRVLIICDRAAECDTIRVLVGTMGCQWILASTIEKALLILNRERTSAAMLELPRDVSDLDRMHKNVRELLVRLPGRVIVLTDGIPTPAINEVISKYSIPWVQRDRLVMDLWPHLELMVYPQRALRRVIKVGRLVLDTFLQPVPAGIRYLQTDTRQLVYETQDLTADVAFESEPDSNRTTLLGQIMRTNEPKIAMNGVTVVLKSRRGPLGVRMTNEAGEFAFEFQNERRSGSLEVEVSPNDWVLLVLPPLDWAGSAEDQKLSERSPTDISMMNEWKPPKKKGRLA